MSAVSRISSPRVRSLTLWLAVPVTALAMAATATAAPSKNLTYRMTDLGTLPGMTMSLANFGSLNQRGQAVGWSYVNHYADDTPWIWEKGVLTELDVPAAVAGPQRINDHGQIVGVWMGEQNGNVGTHGFFYGAGGFVPLPEPEGFISAWTQCLNNRGMIAGAVYHPALGDRPIVWEDGQMTILPMLDLGPEHIPTGWVHGINDAGQMVGYSGGSLVIAPPVFSFDGHATLWERGQAIDLGTLDDHPGSMAYAINNAGVVVGHSGVLSGVPSRAFVWSKKTGIVDLGVPPGWLSAMAVALNDRGDIVGSVSVIGDPQPGMPSEWGAPPLPWQTQYNHAVLWKDGQCIDLQDAVPAGSPWTLYNAAAINARGQILTWAVKRNDPPDPADPDKYNIIHVILLDPT